MFNTTCFDVCAYDTMGVDGVGSFLGIGGRETKSFSDTECYSLLAEWF